MIFTTKNKEFAIFGNTITDVKEKWKEFKKELAKNDGKLFGENGALASLFSGKKSNILTPEVLKQLDEFKEKFNTSSLSAEALAEQMENVDQRIIDYAKTCKNGEMTTEGFKASIDTMSFSAKAGAVALKALSIAGNMLVSWAIFKVISVTVEAIDNLTHASEKCKERIEELQSSYESLQSEHEQLLAKEGLTQSESDRLSYLERRLELDQQILEAEKRQLAQQTIGTDRWDIYDKDSLAKQMYDEKNISNLDSFDYLEKYYNANVQQLEKARKNGNTDAESEYLNNLSNVYGDLIEKEAQFLDSYQKAKDIIDEGLLSGDDAELAEKTAAFFKDMYDRAVLTRESIEKYQGTFDAIKSLNKRDFFISNKDDIQGLMESEKELGEITETLKNKYPELSSYLNDTGTSVESLRNYMLGLNDAESGLENTDINLETEEVDIKTPIETLNIFKDKISEVGKALTTILSDDYDATELISSIATIEDSLKELNIPIDWDSITSVDELKAKIQELSYTYMDSFLSENNIPADSPLADTLRKLIEETIILEGRFSSLPVTIANSVDQLSTQVKSQFDELGEAYKSIFTDEGFTLDDVDNEMFEGIRSSLTSLADDLGVSFDPSNLESFFAVLSNGASTADQVQQAFNELATSYLYSTEVMSQLNDETATAIEKQLYEMGVVNAHAVVTEALTQKKLELAAANEYTASTGDDLANASGAEIAAFAAELEASGQLSEELAQLLLQKALLNGTTINTAADIDNLYNLALQAGATVETLNALAAAKANFGSTGSAKLDSLRAQKDAHFALKDAQTELKPAQVKLDFNPVATGGKSGGGGASKAGKKAADEYLEAFNKELEKLKDLKDRGKITEKEYLDQLRVLYLKYFKDKKKYLDQYQKYENEYLQGMKSLYQKAFSAVTKILDKQIDSYEKQKKSAVDALEAEQKARKENLEAQKEALQEQIDSIDKQIEIKNKIIDSINDEIDAIKDANEERQREIDLQKKKYKLERAQNQRPILQYSEDKKIHYVNDPKAIRDAQQDVDDAETEKEIADKEKQIKLIEKEISILEDRKTVLEDQQDAIDKQIDALDKYYDNLIDSTEKYWDSLIDGMEQYKSRWDELAEIEEQAELDAIFKQLGLSTQDVLAMSDEAFQKFKGDYLGLLSDIYAGNNQMIDSIGQIADVDMSGITSYLSKTQEYIDSLNGLNLGETASQLNETANTMDKVAKASDSAAKGTSATAESMSTLGMTTPGVSKDIDTIAHSLESISGAENIEAVTGALINMAEAIERISKAFGLSDEDSVGGLISALKDLSELSLESDKGEGIVSQFDALKASVEGVSTAISGSGSSGGDSNGAGKTSANGKKESGGETSGSSLVGSMDELKSKADEILGTGGEDDNGTGIIGQFGQIEQKVTDVTAAIGNGEESGGKPGGNSEGEGTLISSIKTLGETSNEVLGEPGGEGVIGKFEQMEEPLLEANEHVTGISDGLAEIDGQEVECTIKVNIEQNGELPTHAEGTLGDMNLKSGEYTAKYGKAFAKGTGDYKGLPKAEKNALVSEYGQTEMTVLPNGNAVITNQPTMMNLPKGTVIFNEDQTKQIMDNKPQVANNAYADGTGDSIWTTLADGTKVRPLQPGDKMYDLVQKFDAYFKSMDGNLEKLVPNSFYEHQRQMEEITKQINYVNSITNNNRNVQQPIYNEINVTLPNVTNATSAESLLKDLESIGRKKYQVNW